VVIIRQISNYSKMSIRNLLTIYLLIIQSLMYGQQYSFYGVLKLHDRNEEAISYRLEFTEKNGVISGYSLTDIAGPHETKNRIDGNYNSKTRTLTFREKEIIYTKSPLSESIFCFVTYTGKVKLGSSRSKLEGPFSGKFRNNQKCIDGTITLIGSKTVEKLIAKASRAVEKSDKLDQQTKEKYNPERVFDSLTTNTLNSSENIHIFNSSSKVTFRIWDKGFEDGDIINLYHNQEVLLSDFKVTKAIKILEVTLTDGPNVFEIEAVNEGLAPPNTAMIILEGDEPIEFQSNLRKGHKTKVTYLKPKL
jgi:hypothetical protein